MTTFRDVYGHIFCYGGINSQCSRKISISVLKTGPYASVSFEKAPTE